ncbi:MAG: glycosyltransferase family 1 protein [Candidatus Edwardsbacteria bacterium]|nr:glycosyltransferase family 1 protein [Candidatus Edwardsbacteria bacterium]
MKVGVYISNIDPESGGCYTFENGILNALGGVSSRHQFTVFHYGRLPGPLAPGVSSVRLDEQASLPFRCARKIRKILARATGGQPESGLLQNAVARYDVDLMWFTTQAFEPVGVPYIYTVLDLQHRLQPYFPEVSTKGWTWEEREMVLANAISRASFVITPNAVGQKEVAEFYRVPKDRIKILPHPTSDFALHPPVDANPSLVLPQTYIFYPAQFWPHKNHIAILQALRILKDEHKFKCHVVFVGSDKGNREYIQNQVHELGLSGQVGFYDFVATADLVRMYREAQALVYVSFFGPENLPPLEAFALGCPVIAAKVDGAEEQLGDAAVMVDPRNGQDIARAIANLYEDLGLRKRLIERGKVRASKWIVKDYINGIINIIDEFEPIRRCWDSSINVRNMPT